MTALAWPEILESQSQAVKPRLSRAEGTFICGSSYLHHQTLIYQCCIETPAVVLCRFFICHRPSLWLLIHLSVLPSSFLLKYMYNVTLCGSTFNYL